MARSEEALARRADKRKKTVTEQKNIDLEDVKKRQKIEINKAGNNSNNDGEQQQRHHNNNNNYDDNPLKEVGAWKCSSCKNENFASRRFCNSKMCDERRPSNIPSTSYSTATTNNKRPSSRPPNPTNFQQYNRRPPQNSNINSKRPTTRTTKKISRHDEATSKKLIYPKQADRATMSKNQELRKRFLESSGGGKGMDPKDIERAEILIARDERKRQKKEKSKKTTITISPPTTTTTPQAQILFEQQPLEDTKGTKKEKHADEDGEEQDQKMKKEKNEKADVSKSKRDKNTALRNRYQKTRGHGMKIEQIERAKQLMERDESKQRKRRKAATEAENNNTTKKGKNQ